MLPPGRPWGEPAVSDGHGGAGRRAAVSHEGASVACRCRPRGGPTAPGRGQQAGARGRRPPNMALKPTSRIGAILRVWMRNTALPLHNHLRLAGLAPTLDGSSSQALSIERFERC
jgi:hypothetical protein